MTDERPRPQYGEYATPEEVAAIRGTPPPPHPADLQPLAPPPTVPPPRSGLASGVTPVDRRADRVITIALLAFGAYIVLSSLPGFLSYQQTLAVALEATPYKDLVAPASTNIAGYWLAGGWVVLLVLAVLASIPRMRRQRRAFWIPLTAGALGFLAYGIVFAALVWFDPVNAAVLHTVQ